MKIEQSHEKMMGQLSQFLDRLTPTINDYHSQLDNLQQELACNNKMHQLELEEQQVIRINILEPSEISQRKD